MIEGFVWGGIGVIASYTVFYVAGIAFSKAYNKGVCDTLKAIQNAQQHITVNIIDDPKDGQTQTDKKGNILHINDFRKM